jgi:hypothetical protein
VTLDYYVASTGAATVPSRVWQLRFHDLAQPWLGGLASIVTQHPSGAYWLATVFSPFAFQRHMRTTNSSRGLAGLELPS